MDQATLAVLDGITEVSGTALVCKPQQIGSSQAKLTALRDLAEARGEPLSEGRLRIYLSGLAEFDVCDVQAATQQIGLEKRSEYEPKYPELGTLRARTRLARAERLRPAKWVPCGSCSVEGLVYVDGNGNLCDPTTTPDRGMRECECKQTWKRAKLERAE